MSSKAYAARVATEPDMVMSLAKKKIKRVLIANRGEIASRIIRTARILGIETVAIYSDADRQSPHVAQADDCVHIGGPAPADSYLNIDAIIRAVKSSGADAVHPGYGFLAENADFAQAVLDNQIIWMGPSAEVIRSMGNKAQAKDIMLAAGVACIPGYQGVNQSDDDLIEQANRIGFPLMVKAAAGGGGRGMRRVESPSSLPEALARARAEAMTAFGSSELILERAIINARHVEIQIVGDQIGNVIHLGERDCSVQRRHQKLIEESPSPAVDKALRQKMGAMAVKAAQSIGYVGVGTIECLLGDDGVFYFMEMNTRLQVEHAVTEAITGIDLVAWQFLIAEGKPLPLAQQEVGFAGHAIEVRLTAEDVSAGFLPQTGVVSLFCPPAEQAGIRIDHCLATGMEISPYYDSMIAKVIAVGSDRAQALGRLSNALRNLVVLGVPTNQVFLQDCIQHPVFTEGNARTDFIDHDRGRVLKVDHQPSFQCLSIAALACAELLPGLAKQSAGAHDSRLPSLESLICLKHHNDLWRVSIRVNQDHSVWTRVSIGSGEWTRFDLVAQPHFSIRDRKVDVFDQSCAWSFYWIDPLANTAVRHASGTLRAPLGAKITRMNVVAGESVVTGQVLAIMEAMKMEHAITAPFDGVVSQVWIKLGDQVRVGAQLMLVEQ